MAKDVCEKCGKPVNHPAEHEFCKGGGVYAVHEPEPGEQEEVDFPIYQPPKTQPKITHEIMPPYALPPRKRRHLPSDGDGSVDGWQDFARKEAGLD